MSSVLQGVVMEVHHEGNSIKIKKQPQNTPMEAQRGEASSHGGEYEVQN
jgi:hypothetical protein